MNKYFQTILVLFLTVSSLSIKAQKHPYLFFTDQKVQQLKQQIKSNTAIEQAWQLVYHRAKIALQKKAPEGSMEDLCLAYRMTADKAFADKIKEILLSIGARKTWEAQEMLNRQPPWHAGLSTAAKSYTMSMGFDCIYDYLDGSQREAIVADLIRLGIQPTMADWINGDSRIHSLNSMGHNWWSAAVFMAGVASLAVEKEAPQAKEWVKTIADASLEWFGFAGDNLINKTRTFGRQGGYYESVGYGDFAMKEYLLFRLAYINRFKKMPFEIPLLAKVADFFVNACYPNDSSSMMLNFGDSHVDNRDWYPIILFMANGYLQERYRWFLKQLQKGVPEGYQYFDEAFGLVYNVEKNGDNTSSQPDLPPSCIYPDIGWGMLRSSWDNNGTLLAVKCGDTWNHAHADAGSFVLFHNGENLLQDGGTVFYNSPAYSDYFFQSKAHNVVLFNGEGQRQQDQYYGVKNQGKLYHMMDGGNIRYIYADATGPTSQNFDRNYRHFLWIGNVILVIDDLKAREAGKMEWLLHYGDCSAKKIDAQLKISKGKAEVYVEPLYPETLINTGFQHDFPEKLILKEMPGIHDHTGDQPENYYSIQAPEKIRQTKWITAIILGDSTGKPQPLLEKFQSKDMLGIRIIQGNIVTKVYLNLNADGRMMGRNSNNSFGGWQTDAFLTAVRFRKGKTETPENILDYFVAGGSYLRQGTTQFLNSLSRVYLISQFNKGHQLIKIQGQPYLHAYIQPSGHPREIELNGKKTPASYDKGMLEIKIVHPPISGSGED